MNHPRVVLLFKSEKFDLSWPDQAGPKDGDPWGRDCVALLAEQLPTQGVRVVSPKPYWGEGGWYLDIEVGKHAFTLFVQWLPVGKPASDFWTVQLRHRRGILGSMLHGAPGDSEYREVRAALEHVLVADGGATAVRWLTLEELAALA